MIVPAEDDERLARAAAGLRPRARRQPHRLPRHDRPQPPLCRPGRPLPGGLRGAPRGQRRRGRGPAAARLRGHRRLPPAAAGDERRPGRARTLLRRDDPAARRLRRAVRDRVVATVEAYLDNDGNVAATAKQLFTHRHTVRYRLERVRELCGHDVSATEGRRSSASALRRCGCWGSPRRAARRWSRAPAAARSPAPAKTERLRALRRPPGATLPTRSGVVYLASTPGFGPAREGSSPSPGIDSLTMEYGGASLDPEVPRGPGPDLAHAAHDRHRRDRDRR